VCNRTKEIRKASFAEAAEAEGAGGTHRVTALSSSGNIASGVGVETDAMSASLRSAEIALFASQEDELDQVGGKSAF
jgi:hypothetical protein